LRGWLASLTVFQTFRLAVRSHVGSIKFGYGKLFFSFIFFFYIISSILHFYMRIKSFIYLWFLLFSIFSSSIISPCFLTISVRSSILKLLASVLYSITCYFYSNSITLSHVFLTTPKILCLERRVWLINGLLGWP
jgi:hypothetical protein